MTRPGEHVLSDTGRYRRISTRMWGDERFCQLSRPAPNAQSLWVYLLTGPHVGIVPGLYSTGERALCEQLGWSLKGFRKAWRELERLGMVAADWPARVLWVAKSVRHNPPAAPNVVKSWRVAIADVPECALKARAIEQLSAYLNTLGASFSEAFGEIERKPSGKPSGMPSPMPSAMPSPKPSPNQDQEQDQEQEQDQDRARPSGKASALASDLATNRRTVFERDVSPPTRPRGHTGSGVLAGALPRDHLGHAFCDATCSRCVPRAVHDKLANLLAPKYGGDRGRAGEALRAFYATTVASVPEAFVMGDAFKFWQARFDAAFATTDTPTPGARRCHHAPRCADDVACTERELHEQLHPDAPFPQVVN